jgi:hypothetical protein
MKRLLVGLLWAGAIMAANPPVYESAGAMRCGVIQRSPGTVQEWCYTGLVYSTDTAIINGILYVRVGDVFTSRRDYKTDVLEWTYTRGSDGIIYYSVTSNGVETKTGAL